MTTPGVDRPVAAGEAGRRESAILHRFASLARRAWRWEVGVWVSLWRFVTRRPRVPAGAVAFPYHGPVRSILIVFIVLSAIEIPIIDLLVHRWPVVRIALLAGGIWGLTWMVGLLLGFITRPHAVGPAGVRLHDGPHLRLDVSWDDIASVGLRRDLAQAPPKPPRISVEGAVRILHLRMQDETNLEIELERSVQVMLPDGPVPVDVVRLWVDDPRGFLREAARHL